MKNAARFFLICGVVAAGVAAMAEARRYYLCGKCAIAVGKEKTPAVFACSGGGHHRWTDLGTAGNSVYLCRKCTVAVKTAARPNPADCPASGHHDWTLLGKTGRDRHLCRKCKIKLAVSGRP